MNSSSDTAAADRGDDTRDARIRWAGVIGLALTLAALLLFDTGRIRERLFDSYQRLLPRTVPEKVFPVRIIAIDEPSLAAFGRWPWPRSMMADLARAAFRRGALAIGFDMIFAEPDSQAPARLLRGVPNPPPDVAQALAKLPDQDAAFAVAAGRLPVVFARAGSESGRAPSPGRRPVAAPFVGDPAPERLPHFSAAVTNIPVLDDAAAGHASLNVLHEADGVRRRVPLVTVIAGRPVPTLSLEVLRVAADIDRYGLQADGDRLAALTIGDRTIQTEPDGGVRPYFSPPYPERRVSALALLQGKVAADAFRNSVVLIGASAVGLGDIVTTPVAADVPGVDVHAQMIEAILSHAWLKRPSRARLVEFGGALLLGLLAILLLPRLGPWTVIGATVLTAVAVAGASFAAFAGERLLLDPIVPGGVAFATALSMLCMMFVEADRALIRRRIEAARVDGEMKAARNIQAGMMPNNDRLRLLPEPVDVQAVLRPARSVSGDLYDAFMLGDDRLCFLIGDVTGKGVPASLFMALSKALTKSAMLRRPAGLAGGIEIANAEIARENAMQMFVTAILGVLDLATGEVEMVNAGHEDPLVLSADGTVRAHGMEGGPPLSVVEGFPYPVERLRLAPGDMLVLTTDGVTEARDPDGEMFGRDRVLTLLRGPDAPHDSAGAVGAIERAVAAFEAGRERSDDLTVLAVRYLGGRR